MKDNKHKILTATILTSLAGLSIYGINKLINKTATIKDLLYPEETNHTYEWRFGNIYYTKEGSGSPLLLLHDLNQYGSSYQWNQVVSKLAQTHTVYTIDLLGCGRSDHPNITYTNFLYVQLLCDFISEVIQEKTDVIASGYSSSFLITSCNINPDIYGKLILVNPEDLAVLNQAPTHSTKILKILLETPLIGTLVYNMLNRKDSIELLFTERLYYNPFHVSQKEVDICYEAAHLDNGNGRYLMASMAGRYINLNIAHALKSINNSIYIISGSHKENGKEIADQYENYNSAIEFSSIPKTKALPELENPSAFLDQINLFLNS